MAHPSRPGPAADFQWRGYNWHKENFNGGAGNGVRAGNARVNEKGQLVLSIRKDGSTAMGGEVRSSIATWGYGLYGFEVGSRVDNIHTNVVVGLFTYGGSRASKNEIDFEASSWGSGSTVRWDHTYWQDTNGSNRYPIGVDNPPAGSSPTSRHIFRWAQDRIEWWSFDNNGKLIGYSATEADGRPYNYSRQGGGNYSGTTYIPRPGGEFCIFNLWALRGGSAPPDTDIVFNDFRFAPDPGARGLLGENGMSWEKLVAADGGAVIDAPDNQEPPAEEEPPVSEEPTPTGDVVVVGGEQHSIDAVDSFRDADKLAVYTPKSGTESPANQWGTEAAVAGGKVIDVRDRQTNNGPAMAIPANGFVLSGHGAARDWLNRHATVGAVVSLGATLPQPEPEEPEPTPTPEPEPTPEEPTAGGISWPRVARGARGDQAKTVQGLLVARGHAPANTIRGDGSLDGIFGAGTERALQALQAAADLEQSGATDEQTWRALLNF